MRRPMDGALEERHPAFVWSQPLLVETCLREIVGYFIEHKGGFWSFIDG
jgi:hypothetical protein